MRSVLIFTAATVVSSLAASAAFAASAVVNRGPVQMPAPIARPQAPTGYPVKSGALTGSSVPIARGEQIQPRSFGHKQTDSLAQKGPNAVGQMSATQMSFNLQYLQLQSQMQYENRSYTALSNIMKTKHDAVKSGLNNIR